MFYYFLPNRIRCPLLFLLLFTMNIDQENKELINRYFSTYEMVACLTLLLLVLLAISFAIGSFYPLALIPFYVYAMLIKSLIQYSPTNKILIICKYNALVVITACFIYVLNFFGFFSFL